MGMANKILKEGGTVMIAEVIAEWEELQKKQDEIKSGLKTLRVKGKGIDFMEGIEQDKRLPVVLLYSEYQSLSDQMQNFMSIYITNVPEEGNEEW